MSKTIIQGLSVPVGTVLAYGGVLTRQEFPSFGWMLCDGTILTYLDFPELAAVIGSANGGDGRMNFNLPDYRGRFLRGVDPDGKVDPNAGQRTPMNNGGLSGAFPGSIQGFATCHAHNLFAAEIPHLPVDRYQVWTAGDNTNFQRCADYAECVSDSGGDNETRPINIYVNFIIKVRPAAGLIIGSMIPFAGENGASPPYLLCDGRGVTEVAYPKLQIAISNLHGAQGSTFNLPDGRGRFLRGADNGSGRDPDTAKRVAANKGGVSGDSVGTVQGWATARPVNPFNVDMGEYFGLEKLSADYCAGHDMAGWEPNSNPINFTARGGDKETRPKNSGVDWLILSILDPNEIDIFPVGAVIGIPGTGVPPAANWLLCDGSSLPTNIWPALSAALGTIYGKVADNVVVPDYRGRFLRGTDHGAGHDPDAATRGSQSNGGADGDKVGTVQRNAVGAPDNPIKGNARHLPSNSVSAAAGASGPGAKYCSAWNSDSYYEYTGNSSGDKEARPINANIHWYIKGRV